MYLALSNPPVAETDEFENPYYRLPVAYKSTGYLKFRLGPELFSKLRALFPGRLWTCMFVWNCLCWALLAGLAIYFFEHYLPDRRLEAVILCVTLLMLFNFSSLKPLLSAWVHLPSLAGFETIELPFMRAFVPVMPVILLVVYLALQIEVLRRVDAVLIWIAMAVLQFLALAMFPYATLMMAGLTAIAVLGTRLLFTDRRTLLTVGAYAVVCGLIDAFFARGPLGFYNEHASLIHLQPGLLPHLVGGNWLLLGLLSLAVVMGRGISPDVKWPLAGLGATNLILMLGDAIVPARSILLSHHAGYFVPTTTALLLPFAVFAVFPGIRTGAKVRPVFIGVIGIIIVNGLLMSAGIYRGWRLYNQEASEIAGALTGPLEPQASDLVIAQSRFVDDACGWIPLLTKAQVLYCTDAQVMLTPQQNLEIHRFRQAIYLYLTGNDSVALRQTLRGPNRLKTMYELGYWAEAASLSSPEQNEGVQAIESQIVPWLERVEQGDPEVHRFFQHFRGVVVVDKIQMPAFVPARLETFLKPEEEREVSDLRIGIYTAR